MRCFCLGRGRNWTRFHIYLIGDARLASMFKVGRPLFRQIETPGYRQARVVIGE